MVGLEDRIEGTSPDLVAKLEAGEVPAGLDPRDAVAAIAHAALGDGQSGGPGLVQGPTRSPRLVKSLTYESLSGLFPGSDRPEKLALAAGLLQMLDAWEASHAAAQEADDLGEKSTAAYWHLIAHRREPDAGNALYWTRRVGRHPIHRALAERAGPILGDHAARLAPGGVWSPSAMIDLATRARPGTPDEALARRLQALEMVLLLEASLAGVDPRV